MTTYIAFDLGGTKMVAAAVDEEYAILAREKAAIGQLTNPEDIFGKMCDLIDTALEESGKQRADLGGIAVGVPSPVNPQRGIVEHAPNLAFNGFPLKDRLFAAFDVPVLVENDVNAGTYGEFRFGAATRFEHVIGVFPGTGIGGGLILNGKLYRGAFGGAGEIGHMIIQSDGPRCGCGRHGCIEALASRTAIAKDAIQLAASGKSPTVMKMAGTDLKKVRSKVLLRAVENDEAPMQEVIERAADLLGVAMGTLVNLFNPQAFVIGGGVVEKLGRAYTERLAASMRAHAMPHLAEPVEVLEAKLGDDATLIGATALLRDEL